MSDPNTFTVDTSPTKTAVVESLTGDATVIECVLDLIDNSIDGARNTLFRDNQANPSEGLPESYSAYHLDIRITPQRFTLSDNCGGISVDDLSHTALRFGKPSSHELGIGLYGIGLNRAIFRLGRKSVLKTDDGEAQSTVIIDVDEYLKTDDWRLKADRRPSRGGNGSSIDVTKISEEASNLFSSDDWIDGLTTKIGESYAHFLSKGFIIRFNGTPVTAKPVQIRENGPFQEKYKTIRTPGGVSIHIRCGQHVTHRFPQEKPDYDPDVNKALTPEFGWTITCNDRSVIVRDTTYRTGWEGKFHSEFYGFCGEVQFISRQPSLLPWDTTKSDVDLHNLAYQQALEEMRRFTAEWRKFQPGRKLAGRQGRPLQGVPAAKPSSTPRGPSLRPSATPPGPPPPKAVKKSSYVDVREVLPEDVNEAWINDKLLVLVHEAKSLDLATHSYSGLALLRMLFEQSVLQLFNRSGTLSALTQFCVDRREAAKSGDPLSQEEKKRPPALDEVVAYLEKNPAAWGPVQSQHLKHSLADAKKRKPLMNGVVHNPYQIVDRTEAYAVRNELLPILRHLIETKEVSP
jgi:hypothetical protein